MVFSFPRAIAESIALQSGRPVDGGQGSDTIPEYSDAEERLDLELPTGISDDLRIAIQLSERENMEAERLRRQEEEELNRILQLSLTEK